MGDTGEVAAGALDLEFMVASEYASKCEIIDGATATNGSYHEILRTQTKEIGDMQKEWDARRAKHERLHGNPWLSLDDYCWACPWKGMLTCDKRVRYLQEEYCLLGVN